MKFELKKGDFFKALNLVNRSRKSLLYAVIADLFFFAVLYFLGRISNTIGLGALENKEISKLLFMALVYYMLLLFVYSFFKYIVLHIIKSCFKQKRIDLNRLGKFYMMNILLFLELFLVFFLLSLLAASIREGIAPYVSLLILLLYSMAAYGFINLAQILFFEGKGLWESQIAAGKNIRKLGQYYGVYLVITAALLAIFLIFGLFGNALKVTLFQDYNSLLKFGDAYAITFIHSLAAIFYIAVLFNRYYFYTIVKEKFLK
jgi:hypothetical protein